MGPARRGTHSSHHHRRHHRRNHRRRPGRPGRRDVPRLHRRHRPAHRPPPRHPPGISPFVDRFQRRQGPGVLGSAETDQTQIRWSEKRSTPLRSHTRRCNAGVRRTATGDLPALPTGGRFRPRPALILPDARAPPTPVLSSTNAGTSATAPAVVGTVAAQPGRRCDPAALRPTTEPDHPAHHRRRHPRRQPGPAAARRPAITGARAGRRAADRVPRPAHQHGHRHEPRIPLAVPGPARLPAAPLRHTVRARPRPRRPGDRTHTCAATPGGAYTAPPSSSCQCSPGCDRGGQLGIVDHDLDRTRAGAGGRLQRVPSTP